MKIVAGMMVSVPFAILMAGGAYAPSDDAAPGSGEKPPIWQVLKNGKAVNWVVWTDNRRFAIYNSGTPNDLLDDMVLDKETGLVWERSPRTPLGHKWFDAQFQCWALTAVGNRRGWRMPTIEELASLVDPSVASPGPTLPSGHPFVNVQHAESDYYWSASTDSGDYEDKYDVTFSSGEVSLHNAFGGHLVWCVRGGQGVEFALRE